MQTAQILDVDVRADHDLVSVRPKHRAVPHRRRPAQRYSPDDDRAGFAPSLRMNNRACVAQRPDKILPLHRADPYPWQPPAAAGAAAAVILRSSFDWLFPVMRSPGIIFGVLS